jgi:membrane-bound metal-dependent hydrolase YbcI (DUF457 family)
MKGIAHFASAVAAASFLPQVVERSGQGSFILLLAGLGGLMPDVFDFRLARFLPKPDADPTEIDGRPGSATPADMAQALAERLAAAIERARRTGKPVHVRLGTVKLGVDLWQRYSVRFEGGRVRVRVGPLVDGAQTPVNDAKLEGDAAVAAPMEQPLSRRGDAGVVVDVFSGTALEFRPRGGKVEIVFLPWHRRWSHSLALTALFGGIAALLLSPLAGLVYALGSLIHILEDQLGYMGSNLLFPLTRTRTGGLGLFHSGDALPNLFAVWVSAVLLLLNLDRFSPAPVLDPWRLLVLGVVVPWASICALVWWARRRGHERRLASDTLERQAVVVDVSEDGERVFTAREQSAGGECFAQGGQVGD